MPKEMNPYDRLIGENVKRIRQIKKMTQAELSVELNVSFQQVQKYERGMNRISAGTLATIAEALEEPITSFFEGIHEDVLC